MGHENLQEAQSVIWQSWSLRPGQSLPKAYLPLVKIPESGIGTVVYSSFSFSGSEAVLDLGLISVVLISRCLMVESVFVSLQLP